MHTITRVLVRVADATNAPVGTPECADDIMTDARDTMERFIPHLIDYIEPSGPVIFGSSAPEYLINELQKIQSDQKAMMENFAKSQKGDEMTFVNILNTIWEKDTEGTQDAYDIARATKLLFGSYCGESGYYDSDGYIARVTNKRLEEVRKAPSKWALATLCVHH